jgi:hypothetical protein
MPNRYRLACALLTFALLSLRANATITLTPVIGAPTATTCTGGGCSSANPSCFRAPVGTAVPVTLVVTNTGSTTASPGQFLLTAPFGGVTGFLPPPGLSCSPGTSPFPPSGTNTLCLGPLLSLAPGASYSFSFTFTPTTLPTEFFAMISEPVVGFPPPGAPGSACILFAPPPIPALSGMELAALAILIGSIAIIRLR